MHDVLYFISVPSAAGMCGTVTTNPIEDTASSLKVSVRGITADFIIVFTSCTVACIGEYIQVN